MKPIALFGGSFNPPHVGHREVVESLAKNPQFTEVWVLPTFSHPFDKSLIDFSHRLRMCELNFGDLGKKVKICGIEGEFKKTPSYMIDTIKALKKKYPDAQFTIIVGGDCRNELDQWKKIDQLKKEARFLFIPRAGFEKSPFTNISSTEIRKSLTPVRAMGGSSGGGPPPAHTLRYAKGSTAGGGRRDRTYCPSLEPLVLTVKKYIEENKLYG